MVSLLPFDFLLSFPVGLAFNLYLFGAVSSVIAAGDLELPSADEEDDIGAEQTPVEAVPSGRKKRKGAGISGEFGIFQLFFLNLFCFLFSDLCFCSVQLGVLLLLLLS